jgi:hypothetical protein
MLARAELGDIEPRRGDRQLGRRAVLVGRADVEHVAAGPQEAWVDIGRQHRSHQVAEVLDSLWGLVLRHRSPRC